MKLKELAKELGISDRQLTRWRALGLPHHRAGTRTVLYFLDEVIEWVRKLPATDRHDPPGRRGGASRKAGKHS